MIEVFSTNVTVPAGGVFPLGVTKIVKGETATRSGDSIQLNRMGVYNVNVSASLEPSAAGDVVISLYRDGVAQESSSTTFTGAVDTIGAASFSDLIQCPQNNNPCCCASSPVTLTLVNAGDVDVTGSIRIVVTKIC